MQGTSKLFLFKHKKKNPKWMEIRKWCDHCDGRALLRPQPVKRGSAFYTLTSEDMVDRAKDLIGRWDWRSPGSLMFFTFNRWEWEGTRVDMQYNRNVCIFNCFRFSPKTKQTSTTTSSRSNLSVVFIFQQFILLNVIYVKSVSHKIWKLWKLMDFTHWWQFVRFWQYIMSRHVLKS